jgi:phage tail P2-like protein
MSNSVARLSDVPVPIAETWSPYECPSAILPYLAWALSVDDWDASWTENQKREAIAHSIEIHRRKGTLGALKRALQRLNYEVEVDENTGQAYTFRLNVNVTGSMATDWTFPEIKNAAFAAKNVRSFLETIRALIRSASGELKMASVLTNGELTKVFPA